MSKKYMMIITHSTDHPHLTSVSMGLVSCLVLEGAGMALFFMSEGAKLCQKGVAETIEEKNIAPVRHSLSIIREGNTQLYVCKIDLKKFGIEEDQLLDGVKIVDLMDVSTLMMERETLKC
ncbi:MAG: DsrE family protein [Proteobacteria bacterium]|nr:DsrE family protein [Pseudomonadota bacterium]